MDELFRSNAGGTQEWPEVAEDGGFLLLVPNGTGVETGDPSGDDQRWNDCRSPSAGGVTGSTADDVGFLVALADWAGHRFPVSDRVLVTGASNGGMMAYRLATERPGRVAGVAAFVANLPEGGECSDPSQPVPILIVNGTADPITPYAGEKLATEARSARPKRHATFGSRPMESMRPAGRSARCPTGTRATGAWSCASGTRLPGRGGGPVLLRGERRPHDALD